MHTRSDARMPSSCRGPTNGSWPGPPPSWRSRRRTRPTPSCCTPPSSYWPGRPCCPGWRRPQRDRARERVAWMTDRYAGAGLGVPAPSAPGHGSVDEGCAALVKAIIAGDLGEVDRHATWLGDQASVAEPRTGLGAAVSPMLASAVHASILLHLMGHAPALGTMLVRGPARELARQPHPSVPVEGRASGAAPLVDALLNAPCSGRRTAPSSCRWSVTARPQRHGCWPTSLRIPSTRGRPSVGWRRGRWSRRLPTTSPTGGPMP